MTAAPRVAMAAAILLAGITAPSSAAAASTPRLRLGPVEMLGLAERAEAAGDLTTAGTIYAALATNPDPEIRAEARFRHAKQFLRQRQLREAALLLRRILDEKPDATVVRLELAHALDQLGDPDAALRELRAAQSAGLPASVARLVDRYSEALRAARPLGASLEIAIAPDSNINRSTRSDTLGTIFGDFDISQGSKAKSGTGLSLRGHVFRRFALGDGDTNLLFRGGAFADLYQKGRFNDIAVDVAVGPELLLGRNRINLELGATHRWFGQEPFTRSARVGASIARPLGTRMQVRLSGSAAIVDNRINDLQDGKTCSVRAELERALSPTMGVAVNASFDRQALKDSGYSTSAWRLGALAWKDVGRMTFTTAAEFGRLQGDERLALFPEKRADDYRRFTVSASLRQLSFQGFAPVARFTIERNRSSIEFYDYRRTRSEFGIVRAF